MKKLLSNLFYYSTLVYRLFRFPPKAIWIGDSHSFFIANQSHDMRRITSTKSGDLVCWMGPKLMYSVANYGLQLSIPLKLMIRIASSNSILILVFGEIDCRVHLSKRFKENDSNEIRDMVMAYKSRVLAMCDFFSFKYAIALTPTPPSDHGIDNPDYPRNGTLAERVSVTNFVSDELKRLKDGRFKVLELNRILASKEGSLESSLTDDGVHVNAQGASLIIATIAQMELD